jgi:hypothetical protein
MAFDLLREKLGQAQGAKEYLQILELAAKESETQVDEILRITLEQSDAEITAKVIADNLGIEGHVSKRDVQVEIIDLEVFDQLCEIREVLQ